MQIHVPTNYELYLQSPEFDEIRQAVFARDNHKCVVCGKSENIQPHHLTYRNIYNEQLADLVTLCRTCHATYHAVQKRADFINEIYKRADSNHRKQQEEAWKAEQEERTRKYQEERDRNEAEWAAITQEIKDEYFEKDYCKNGDLDMCDWSVLNPIIEQKAMDHNVSPYGINKMNIQKWFIYRRCEFFQRCLEKNISLKELQEKTKFDPGYLWKWYKPQRVSAKLKEEQELFSKEDKFL